MLSCFDKRSERIKSNATLEEISTTDAESL